jgi:hypothetical protein
MHVTITKPVEVVRISSYSYDSAGTTLQLHAVSMEDRYGNQVEFFLGSRREVRRVAAAFDWNRRLSLRIDERDGHITDPDLIRRWINGDDLAFAGFVGSPMQVGAEA